MYLKDYWSKSSQKTRRGALKADGCQHWSLCSFGSCLNSWEGDICSGHMYGFYIALSMPMSLRGHSISMPKEVDFNGTSWPLSCEINGRVTILFNSIYGERLLRMQIWSMRPYKSILQGDCCLKIESMKLKS